MHCFVVGEEPEECKQEEEEQVKPVEAKPVQTPVPLPVACFPELQFDSEDGDLV